MILREPEMFRPMIEYLHNQGYEVVMQRRDNEVGADIVARKAERNLNIEMKGDSAAIKTDWDTGLGQLLDGMNDPEAHYAIAVSEAYERLARALPALAREKLGLRIFIISERGMVDEI